MKSFFALIKLEISGIFSDMFARGDRTAKKRNIGRGTALFGVMGVLAVRLQSLNRELEWDGPNMRFTNIPEGETIRTMIEDGFSVKDGHPTFNKTYTDPVDANAYAAELIKHTYREGWSLPPMPED